MPDPTRYYALFANAFSEGSFDIGKSTLRGIYTTPCSYIADDYIENVAINDSECRVVLVTKVSPLEVMPPLLEFLVLCQL
ncbi:hypothetical protein AB1N83_008052 [Pleurotus pulmonarius]